MLNLVLNVNPKVRGIPAGPDLDATNTATVKVTKTILARLTGQCYMVSGSFLDPVLISFKIHFSMACKLLSNWHEECVDPEFVQTFRDFLEIIKNGYKSLRKWPRLLIPHGFKLKRIVCHTDGSAVAASYVFFLISEDEDSCFSINTDAGSRIKMHSVPCNECSGLVLGVTSVIHFIMTHYQDLQSMIEGTL